MPDDQIVDTNGAGDMFAGGFIAALSLGKSLPEAVDVGHQLGAMCITQVRSLDEYGVCGYLKPGFYSLGWTSIEVAQRKSSLINFDCFCLICLEGM